MNILFSKTEVCYFNFSFFYQNVGGFYVSRAKKIIYLWTIPSLTRAKNPLQISTKIALAEASFRTFLGWDFKYF